MKITINLPDGTPKAEVTAYVDSVSLLIQQGYVSGTNGPECSWEAERYTW
ncbi:hypothetical protein Mycsm_06968 (plasmid) [Mycobacterium sp. JS623]|nr:hypothetical protein [Mycobacterium sp. JS623]AGB27069.1 hypothetical protein Mycsm_06968 [Mycobacterium sp. JS623]